MWRPVARIEPPLPLMAAAIATLSVGVFSMLSWREVKAKELYLGHCDTAMAYPEFSKPDTGALDIGAQTFGGDAQAFEQYEWYVARLVYTLDECLKLAPLPHWYETAKTQLSAHKRYFASDYYAQQDYLPHYSKRMQMLIKRAAHA
jgi:hypothetical protein